MLRNLFNCRGSQHWSGFSWVSGWTGGSRLAVAIGALLAKDHRTENQLVCSRPDAEEKNNQRLCPCIRH
ncbi:hypothetical protein DAI22_02g229432 [Oryza sativa Japonica Group]|nr:hypothetical protein DAI22_02g229432 [Oryza sativa Japonica Group]